VLTGEQSFGKHPFDANLERSAMSVSYAVVVPNRIGSDWVGSRAAGPTTRAISRPTPQIYVRRRLVVALVLVTVVVSLWMGVGAVLASRGGVPASAPTVRPVQAPAAAGLSATATEASSTYTVQPGDTLWSIAQSLPGDASLAETVNDLVDLNGGASLEVGQVIVLP
jgi:LysM repeat protein